MKNKILGIMLLMAICLISVTAVQAGNIVGKIGEGETRTFIVDNVEYEVTALVVTELFDECKLKINGEVTELLGPHAGHDSYTLADGSKLEIRDITDSTILFYLGRPGPHYDCRGQIGVLEDCEWGRFSIYQQQYEISAEKYYGNFKLKVNGEQTDWLYIGTEQIMADGLQIKILNMGSNDITFCLTPGPALTPETIQPEEKIDLSNYPDLFIQGRSLNTVFVVGDQAPADDVIAAIDISVSFQKYGVSKTGGAMLASEIDHYRRNIISVGRPCDNAVTAQILRSNGISDYDFDCSYGLKPGQAIVYLFDYHGYAHMLVFGYSRLETRQMARALGIIDMKGTKWLHNFEDRSMPQPEEPEPVEPELVEPKPVREMPECQKKLEQFKRDLIEKYDNRNIPIPEELMEKYDEMHRSCMGDRHFPEPPITEDRYEDCPGCRKNGACIQIGIRFLEGDEPVYCDIDNAFKPQRENDKACMNNYECLSNTCQDGVCQSMGEQIKGIQRELEEQKGILEKIMGFFKRMFSFR